MRGSIKLKVLLIGFFSFLFALLANRNSEGAVYAFEICTLRTYTIECIDGTNNFSTTQYYWDCVTYFGYIYDGEGTGSSGGGESNGGGDADDPGGGGEIIYPDLDKNNDKVLDCYQDLMRIANNSLVITSGFRTTARPNHDGIDIGSTPDRDSCYGQIIFSVCEGVVKSIYFSDEGGWTVTFIDDNGNTWGICHLLNNPKSDSSVNLYEGKRVQPGITPVGRCDSTGSSCDGPHIHLSLKINGAYADPTVYVSGC